MGDSSADCNSGQKKLKKERVRKVLYLYCNVTYIRSILKADLTLPTCWEENIVVTLTVKKIC